MGISVYNEGEMKRTANRLNKTFDCPFWVFNRRTRASEFGGCSLFAETNKDCVKGEGCFAIKDKGLHSIVWGYVKEELNIRHR